MGDVGQVGVTAAGLVLLGCIGGPAQVGRTAGEWLGYGHMGVVGVAAL